MLQFIYLVIAGVVGAIVGWMTGAYLAPQAGNAATALFSYVPTSVQLSPQSGAREIGAAIGLVVCVFALVIFTRKKVSGWATSRGVLAAIVAGGVLYGVSEAGGTFFDTIGVNPLAPAFEFEIRLPAGSKIPTAREDIQIELHTDRNQIITTLREISREGERPVLRGSAPLKFRTTERRIVMLLPGEPVRVFLIRLPAKPAPSVDFSRWQQVDLIEDASRATRRADVTSDYAIRYRID